MGDTPLFDIRALAELARLDVLPEEMARLEKELPSILGFVDQIQKVAGDVPHIEPALRNVTRSDENPHPKGMYTEALLKAAPAVRDGRIVVKQVISRKK